MATFPPISSRLAIGTSANLLNIIINNKELARIEFPINDGTSVLAFDVISSIDHDMTATPTKNPVEEGISITDNVKIQNAKATFDISISDTPLVGLANLSNIFGRVDTVAKKIRKFTSQVTILKNKKVDKLVKKASDLSGKIVDGSFIRSKDAFDLLEKLQKNKILISALIGFKTYKNAIITNVRVLEDKNNENSLVAKISIEELNIVKTDITTVLTIEEDAVHTAQKEQNTGKELTSDPSAKTKSKATTILKGWLDSGGKGISKLTGYF